MNSDGNGNGTVDLHTHSKNSDGTLTPYALVELAKEKNLAAIALTDHESVGGLPEAIAAGKKFGVEIVTGVEMSAFYECELHFVGLFIDFNDEEFKDILKMLSHNRIERNRVILERLSENGINIDLNKLEMSENSSVTRAHFAKLMVDAGYCSTMSEAYKKYLSFGAPAYVPRDKISPEECIRIIHRIGGLAFLAHLNQIEVDDERELIKLVSDLKEMGLDGIEGYYYEYDDEWVERCKTIADIFDLEISGGSDFHGDNKKNELGIAGEDERKIPYSVLKNIKKKLNPIELDDM